MRDMVDEYFDTGIKPNAAKVDDPFWDPPTPILIGQAFLPLDALGYVCDNDVDAAILSADGSAKQKGFLRCGYDPCDGNGRIFLSDNDERPFDPKKHAKLPDELYIEDPNDLLKYNKPYYFKFRIK